MCQVFGKYNPYLYEFGTPRTNYIFTGLNCLHKRLLPKPNGANKSSNFIILNKIYIKPYTKLEGLPS